MDGSSGSGGLLSWFTDPLMGDPAAGLSGLGLLGATLKDVGAAQEGRKGDALENFASQQRSAWANQKVNAGPPYAAASGSPAIAGGTEGGALSGWLTDPIHPNNPMAGLNGLGLLGAAFKDIGAAQAGRQGGALDNFGRRLSGGTAYDEFLRRLNRPR